MSIDMSQFHGVFLEESQEHLDDIERLLMALDLANPDLEELNSIFRAAHSIKGGSGIFGFEALISVTHVMENLFDKARQRQFTFHSKVVDDLLSAVDVLRTLLGSYREGHEPDWSLVESTTKQIEWHLNGDANQDDDGFGFFTDPAEHQEQEQGFGFFKTEPVQSADADDGFGFFDGEPQPAAKAELSPSDSQDGFGFFEPQPDAQPLATASSVKVDTGTPKVKVESPPKSTTKSASTPSVAAANARTENAESSSIRVDISKVDTLVNLAGELVITQSMLNLLGAEVDGPVAERLQSALAELERNTRELQESIMSIRMLPMSFVFNRFPRVVRDLSSKLNKQVELIIEGGQTEIDKGLIERLVDPLTHLVRNSLDHGIEIPALRKERGKDAVGSLTLRAEQKGGNILISVVDDGGGLNREKILAKAQEKGIVLSDNPSDAEVWQLIMAPGFSTAAEVTDVSGRGVGMDVVKRNIEAMGGRIDIQSETGVGSTFQIRLPLTLAILDGMSVSVADQLFIVPLVNIIESVQPETSQLKNIGNQQMLELRDAYWPIVRLHQVMAIEGAQQASEQAILVLIETSKTRFALQVDDLIGQQQVVIKSLEQHYRRVAGIAGATIMGDGSVALILDVESLATRVNEVIEIKDLV
ncbi:chemotaxis protein CheW [Alkalimonas delamerensis]|uniref:Chemotaxis protein CheA n=1 Tax=Alkalimonas delamerensis TaxID=265981 RepID=A0ABT9GNF8_9GAMM|nr:chemotaxis protein CheW [Alkalimonas delamerensis]MDP4528500.1 chemotaxis protein CheW [Alkalimonas delamerensis]